MAKHSYKEQERQRREQEILEKAGQLLVERGYAELNMDELADIVGISKPTLYQHFKGKEELVAQVFLRGIQNMRVQLEATLHGTPLQKLEQILRWNLKTSASSANFWSAMDGNVWQALHSNPELAQQRKTAVEGLAGLVDAAKAAGEIPQELPTLVVVRSMFCFQGVFRNPFRQKDDQVISPEQVDSTIDAVVQMFLHGVTQQPEQQIIRTTTRSISE